MAFAGGNTLISGGEYAAPNNWIQEKKGIKDSKETFYKDILKGGDNEGDPKLIKVLADNALDGAVWLKDYINMTFEDRQLFFGGHSVERSLVPKDATGVEMISKLLKRADELGIKVYYETPAKELIVKDGRVVGVKAVGPENEYTINASKGVILATGGFGSNLEMRVKYNKDVDEKVLSTNTVGITGDGIENEYTINASKGVILATGGFGSNLEMRVKYNKDVDEKVLSTNTVGITGDGILMAEKIGAKLEDMQFIQTYPTCDPISGALLYFGDVRLAGGSILVNQEGKRFVEELERRDVISMAIKKQTGSVAYQFCDEAQAKASGVVDHHGPEMNYLFNNKLLVKANTIKEAADTGSVAYQFCDEAQAKASGVVDHHGPEMNYLFNNKLLVKANTIKEAADLFGIDAAELEKTVAKYNQYAKDGKDLEFNKRGKLTPFEAKGPFYIMKAVPAVHHTMGGLKIDENARVINTQGEVIKGLYGAGEVTGDIHGTNRLGSDAIADITVFGRIAGKTVMSDNK